MTVPARYFDTEDAAERAARWLLRAGIVASAAADGERYAVFVARDHLSAAAEVLDERARGLSPVPVGKLGLAERIFNVENLLTIIFGLAGLILLAGFAVVALEVAAGIGLVAGLAVLVAGLAYFHFSGTHGAVKAPKRVTPKAGPISQDLFVEHDYRRAWLSDQLRGRDRERKAQAKNHNSESP